MVRFHPFTAIFYTVVMFFMVIIYNHPLYVICFLCSIIVQFIILDQKDKLKSTLKNSLYIAAMIFIINPLVSGQAGSTVIFRGPRIPMWGRITVSLESVAYGFNMGLKLMCITLVFMLYGILINRDDRFSFFSKYAGRLVLTFSMSVNIFHRIKLDVLRVKDTMILRGVDFTPKNPVKRLKAYYPLLKVVLISVLEGSLSRAESMFSKQYGKYGRTSYSNIFFKAGDLLFNILNIAFLGLLVYGIVINAGYYSFYPVLQPFVAKDMYFLIALTGSQIIFAISTVGCKKWKFLEYKI